MTVLRAPAAATPAERVAAPNGVAPRTVERGFLVQRAEEDAPPPAETEDSASEPVPAPAPAAAPQSSQPPAPAPAGPQEPEELLKTLFDPLLRRLRTELRLDRERRGVVSDRW
jgi:hypothetical protein